LRIPSNGTPARHPYLPFLPQLPHTNIAMLPHLWYSI
jgi:hypothetical protein